MRIAKAIRKLTVADDGGSIRSEINGSPIAPMRIAKIVMPELRARDEPNRLVHEPQGGSGTAAAAERALLEPRSARGDERVLGRDEHRAPQHEEEHDEDAEKTLTPRSGAPVLGG